MMQDGNMQAVIDAARQGIAPALIEQNEGRVVYFVPHGQNGQGQFYTVDRNDGLAKPIRKRGTVTVFDAASFNQVLKDNSDAGNIAIYLDRNPIKPAIVAVLNGHGIAGTGWADFRANIQFRPTPQWAKWQGIDGKMVAQETFAEFIEENLADISDPAGGTMLDIVTYLQATRTVDFKSAIRLSNGQIQFTNTENIEARVSTGQVAVPETFTLALAPMLGTPIYSVPARFRYRLKEGKLTLGFKLQRIEDLMQQIVDDVVAAIERGANISVLNGVPPDVVR